MKKVIILLVLLIGTIYLFSQQEINVKFYLNDGGFKQYNIADIQNMSIITGELGYKMVIYYQGNLSSEFPSRDIESMRFEDDGGEKILNIYISGATNSFKITEIDSISFIPKEAPAPVITKIDASSGLIGDEVTISGTDFGNERGTSLVSFNGANAEEYISWSDKQIEVVVPKDAKSGPVSVTVNGKKSNEVQFTILAPDKLQITSIIPKSARIGDEIVIKGSKFGSTQGTNFVLINSLKIVEYTGWKDNEIKLKVPIGSKSGKLSATINGDKSNDHDFFVIPQLSAITPTFAAISEKVTLTGIGFGDSAATSKVSFNDVKGISYAKWNDSSIIVEVPPKAQTGKVTVKTGSNISNEVDFQVIQHILLIKPPFARIGDTVYITGTSFGEAQNNAIIAFKGANTVEYISWCDTVVKVIVPTGAKSGKVIMITIDTKESNGVDFLVAPFISNLTPNLARSGEQVTITGNGFGDSTETNKLTFFNRAYVTRFVKWSDAEIIAKVHDDAETGKVFVTTGGIQSNEVDFTSIPKINSLSTTTPKTGDKLTISGTGFCSSRGTSEVTFNGAVGTAYLYWSNRSIEVNVPSGAQSGKVYVTVGGNKSNEKDIAIQAAPRITGISPDSAGIGDVVTITGTDFGDTRGTSIINFKNKTGSEYTSWSSTQIKVKVPTGAATGKVSVTVNGTKSNEVDLKIGSASGSYEEVTIGTQTWMKKNLDVTTYRNGDPIPEVTDVTEWKSLTTGAWCYYDNSSENGAIYGKLYNWYAVNDSRGLAPQGWHVASDSEWDILAEYLGGIDVAGGKIKSTGTIEGGDGLWYSPNTGATNESGFTSLPNGRRSGVGGTANFVGIGQIGYCWTSSPGPGENAYVRYPYYNYSRLGRDYYFNCFGLSVRCIKD